MTSPADGATYLIDPTLRREFQAVPLSAIGVEGPVLWTIDGRDIGTSAPGASLEWPLERGAHRAVVRGPRGRTAEARSVVK